MHAPHLLALEVESAPHAVSQGAIRDHALALFTDADYDLAEAAPVFDNAGIERRTLALPLDVYGPELSTSARASAYREVGTAMLERAAARALGGTDPARVTHVVTISSSGVATPSLDAALVATLGLSPGVRRVPVFGLGCAGGVAGLQIARDLAAGDPEARVLLLCVELCSLTLLAGDHAKRNFVACALFGDGAAAALIGQDDSGASLARLGRSAVKLFEDSADMMGWDILEEGWRVVFSPRIPLLVRDEVRGLVDALELETRPEHWILHPGGARILDGYRQGLELSDEELAPARAVLARQGNMSAATVLFVLRHVLDDEGLHGPALASAFGPGFSADLLQLELRPQHGA